MWGHPSWCPHADITHSQLSGLAWAMLQNPQQEDTASPVQLAQETAPSPGWGFEVDFCSDGGGDRCGPERREGGERRAAGGTSLQLARGWK